MLHVVPVIEPPGFNLNTQITLISASGTHSKKNYGIIWEFFPNGGVHPSTSLYISFKAQGLCCTGSKNEAKIIAVFNGKSILTDNSI